MKAILLLPAVAYLVLVSINMQIFQETSNINFFWLYEFHIPVVIFVSVFFILYIILIWVGFNFSSMFSNMKTRKLEKENFHLKTKLLSKQGDLIRSIEGHFEDVLGRFKKEADNKIESYKKQTDRIINHIDQNSKNTQEKIEKLRKETKK